MKKEQPEQKMVKIHIEECGEIQKLHLEGSIFDWLQLLTKASKTAPEFKKAVVLCADFFGYELEQKLKNN